MSFEEIISRGKGVILHHWDCDGICSAALLRKQVLAKNPEVSIDTQVPVIGNYFFTDAEIEDIASKNYKFVLIADMALPSDNVLKLKEKTQIPILFFDHHLTGKISEVEHINPVADGSPTTDYPCCAYVITENLGLEFGLFPILGIVGDIGDRIKENPKFYSKIEEFMQKHNLTFEELSKIVKLIDSSYIINNAEEIKASVALLENSEETPGELLNAENLNLNLEKISQELEKCSSVSPEKTVGNVLVFTLDTNLRLISPVARELSSKNPDSIVIVADKSNGNIYVRRKSLGINLRKVIELAKSKNYNSGGKEEVAGIILPPSEVDTFVEEIIGVLK